MKEISFQNKEAINNDNNLKLNKDRNQINFALLPNALV